LSRTVGLAAIGIETRPHAPERFGYPPSSSIFVFDRDGDVVARLAWPTIWRNSNAPYLDCPIIIAKTIMTLLAKRHQTSCHQANTITLNAIDMVGNFRCLYDRRVFLSAQLAQWEKLELHLRTLAPT
jgi:hypothetical protein